MSRPEITVVMPFAGDLIAARLAISALRSLELIGGDELILVDNRGGGAAPLDAVVEPGGVRVIRAGDERSPAHARNVGAAHAGREWILFIDSDCRPAPDLLDAYFAHPPDAETGALVGEVDPAPGAATLAARYGAARGFLGQEAHLNHPYRPRAAAANLLVRRAAFEQVGGFYEGVRAGEDTDFSWRLQQAGWRLEPRADARVEHRYRTTLGDLRRQWRGYAAGRAWLARRYEGFEPEPGIVRALRRSGQRLRGAPRARAASDPRGLGRVERGLYTTLDAVMGIEELAGLALSNRPDERASRRSAPSVVVLVADRFPARDDPLVELAQTLDGARIEALARPEAIDPEVARGLDVDYVEDDGTIARAIAGVSLALRHPVRCALDLLRRGSGDPRLFELAPAAVRLERDEHARVQALGAGRSVALAQRLAALSGRPLDR